MGEKQKKWVLVVWCAGVVVSPCEASMCGAPLAVRCYLLPALLQCYCCHIAPANRTVVFFKGNFDTKPELRSASEAVQRVACVLIVSTASKGTNMLS